MKKLKKISISELIKGYIFNSNTIQDKENNTYSAEIIDELIDEANTYSTEEQEIGKWIDGKPIYRKCIKPTNNSIYIGSTDTIENIWISDKTLFYFYRNDSTNMKELSGTDFFYNTEKNWFTHLDMTQNNNVRAIVDVNGYNFNASDSWLVVEYTKTTD